MKLVNLFRSVLSTLPIHFWIFLVIFIGMPAVMKGQQLEAGTVAYSVCKTSIDDTFAGSCGVTTPGQLIQAALEDQFLDCLTIEESRGATLGRAYFTGMPWDGADYGVGIVPGMGMDVVLEDDTVYIYGGEMSAVVADNLSSLQKHWEEGITPPYHAVRRADGSIHILISSDCRTWQMVPPSVIPALWEDHPLAWCLQAYGAFRATEAVTWESEMRLVADFGDEEVSLESGTSLEQGAVIAETFEGFSAFEIHSNQCSVMTLHQIP